MKPLSCDGWLTHNSLSLFVLPALIIYLLVLGLRQRWLLCLAAVALALGLSSFFWLPAIAERSYVNLAPMTQGRYEVSLYLTPLRELFQRSFLFDYTAPQGLRWGLPSAMLALCGFAAGLWRLKSRRRWLLYFALLVAVAVLLQLPAAEPFWTHVPLVRFIQFPWRLLAFVALGGSVLVGALPALFGHRTRSPQPSQAAHPVVAQEVIEGKDTWRARVLAGVVAILLIITATARLWPMYRATWQGAHFRESDISRQDMYERGRLDFELFADYQPIWVQARMVDIPYGRPIQPDAESQSALAVKLQLMRFKSWDIAAQVNAAAPFPLTLHKFYFPGWQARVDGAPTRVYPSGTLGLVTVDVPAGVHSVELRFGDTPLRRMSLASSLLSLLVWFIIAVPGFRRRPWAAALFLVVVLAGTIGWQAVQRSRPTPFHAILGDQVELVGYALDRSDYPPGATMHVSLFWLSTRRADANYRVFVHLRDLGDQQMIGQDDGNPVDNFTPLTSLEPGELLSDEHAFQLPEDLAPGVYQLVVGMYDPGSMQNLAVQDAPQVLPGERISVTQITVTERR